MNRNNFFHKKVEFLTLKDVIEITKGELQNSYNLNLEISDISTIENGTKDKISFLSSAKYLPQLNSSKSGFCLIEQKNIDKAPKDMVLIIHKNPYYAYSLIANAFWEEKELSFKKKLFSTGFVDKKSKIGKNTIISPTAFIANNVEIGKNCFIAPNAVIMQGCKIGDNTIVNSGAVISFATIGNNCKIYSGAKIGQDGFGFAHDNFVNHKIIQLGIVEIGNDVEIGSNTCVDRGAIENTKIGDGVKIDNLVQIAHNVHIGKGTVIAGCSAIAGSTKIGNFVQIGGGSSVNGHITIGDGAIIAGSTGVARSVDIKNIVAGTPAIPIKKWHRLNSMLLKMVDNSKSNL